MIRSECKSCAGKIHINIRKERVIITSCNFNWIRICTSSDYNRLIVIERNISVILDKCQLWGRISFNSRCSSYTKFIIWSKKSNHFTHFNNTRLFWSGQIWELNRKSTIGSDCNRKWNLDDSIFDNSCC